MHLETISNGLGAPSLWLLLMALRKEIPATVSITADTGWENDRLWNTGRRSTNQEYFDEVIVPLCKGSHVTPRFVRSVDKHKRPLLPLGERLLKAIESGHTSDIPLYGSRRGRLRQTCTQKMKIVALRQEARRLLAKTVRSAQGIHFHEADRRVKGRFLRMDGQWSVYQEVVTTTARDAAGNIMRDANGKRVKTERVVKWQTHYYPLVDLRMTRQQVYEAVEKEGIPYITSSECDLCPHKDLARWERSSPHVIDEGERIEELMGGNYFFTDKRIPLKQAIAAMQAERAADPERYKSDTDFGCRNDLCGV